MPPQDTEQEISPSPEPPELPDATIGDIPDDGAPAAQEPEFNLDELAAINEIGRLITSTLHIEKAYEAFASQLAAIIDFDRLVISTLDLERNQFTTRYVTGTIIDGFEVGSTHEYRGRPSEGVLTGGDSIGLNRVQLRDFVKTSPDWAILLEKILAAGLRSTIQTPLISNDEPIGIMGIWSTLDEGFSQHETELAGRVGHQIAGAISNSALHERVEREAAERTALAEIARIVGSSLDFDAICDAFATELATQFTYARIAISTVDVERHIAEARYTAGVIPPGFETGRTYGYANSPLDDILQTSTPLILRGHELMRMILPDNIELYARYGLIETMQIPLVSNDTPIGILSLWSTTENGFGENELNFAALAGAFLAGPLANSQRYSTATDDARVRTALAEIARIVGSSLDFDAICDAFATQLANRLPYVRITISTLDPDQQIAKIQYTRGVALPGYEAGTSFSYANSRLAKQIEEGEPLHIKQHDFSSTFGSDNAKEYASLGLNESLGIPLIADDRSIGVLTLWSGTDHGFGEEDLNFAALAGAFLAGPLANSQRFMSATDDARVRTALAEIGQAVSSDLDFDSICAAFEKSIKGLVQFRRFTVSSWDRENQVLTTRYASGIEIPDFEPGTHHEYVQSPIALTLTEGKIVSLPESLLDSFALPEFVRLLRDLGFGGSLHLPLISNDKVIGAISLWSHIDQGYTDAEQNMLALATPYLAGALSKALLYDEAITEAQIQDVLGEIGRTVSSSPTMDEVYRTFVGQLMRLVQCDRVVIASLDHDNQTLTPVYVEGAEVPGVEVGSAIALDPNGWSRFLNNEKGMILDPEEERSRAADDPLIAARRSAGLRSLASVPLEYRGGFIGTLTVSSRREGAYTEEHLSVLRRVSGQIAGAFANARLYQQTLEDAAELRKLDDERSRFLSTVSHELRTPLTSIVAFADILSRNTGKNLTPRQLQQLTVVQRSGRRLDKLINDLLDISRINEGQFSLDKTEFPVQELLSEVVDGIAPTIESKNQHLELIQPDEDIWIAADRNRIAQVVSNLLTNASKYSPADSSIRITCELEKGRLKITVTDNGIGIAPEDLDVLFTPFFRADNETTHAESGTGLGLVIVKNIVELHGGTLDVESELGYGTSMAFTLPDPASEPSEEYLRQQQDAKREAIPRSRLA